MAQNSPFSTVLDIRNLSEYVTTQVRDDARVLQFIHKADSLIRAALRPYYSVPTGLQVTPWNGPPQTPFAQPDQGIAANTGSGVLSDVTPASTAITELWTLTFSSNTAFTAYASISGSQGTGSTASLFTSTNSYLSIPSANWSGTRQNGDIFYVAVYNMDTTIVTVSALIATGLLLKSVYLGEDESAHANSMLRAGMDLLNRLSNPYGKDALQLGGFAPIDISPEGVQYNIDDLGRDVSIYANNEQTDYDDSTTGINSAFLYGRVW